MPPSRPRTQIESMMERSAMAPPESSSPLPRPDVVLRDVIEVSPLTEDGPNPTPPSKAAATKRRRAQAPAVASELTVSTTSASEDGPNPTPPSKAAARKRRRAQA